MNADHGFPLFGSGTDLRGDTPLDATTQIAWTFFFEGGPPVMKDGKPVPVPQHGEPLDANLPEAVFRLPPPSIGEPPVSLAERNIRRGVDFGLPSGQESASYLTAVYGSIPGVPAEELFPKVDFEDRFTEILKREPALAWATPLWYYILREAGLHTEGQQLGTVGGLIVAETILGSLWTIPKPWFDVAAQWRSGPCSGAPTTADHICSMTQLLQFLGEFADRDGREGALPATQPREKTPEPAE
ncbi:hypothetical protein [Rhodoplanes roseus]|uniref:Uncharacterized protein n=1 Tax=Rhodoplanes roseus TaxID=29409 RepID=A0A327KJH2_9BRAD|nr:hypothetical protein [Rhodoplanes roseus]RAI38930.1 hypothetical protein CH341_26910 [Rhodoplanes roseus]